jgi:hypothetical protein
MATTKLANLKAKIETTLEKSNDNRANTSDVLIKTAQTDIPTGFVFNIPIIAGNGDKYAINVDLFYHVDGNQLQFWLESIDLVEMIQTTIENSIEEAQETLK